MQSVNTILADDAVTVRRWGSQNFAIDVLTLLPICFLSNFAYFNWFLG